MQAIRKALRGKAIILMGKNTLMRRAIRVESENHPELQPLLPHIVGNVGFVFTHEKLKDIKDELESHRVGAPAKVGAISPLEVWVPAGPTGMEPTKTSFLQALAIPSKIMRGQIEIIAPKLLLTVGQKVGNSEASLLQMLGIRPFSYGVIVRSVFEEGSVYDASFLDISDEDVLSRFAAGLGKVASLSLSIGYPTMASLPHAIVNAYKNVLAVCFATGYVFDAVEELKDMVENPEKYASAAPAPVAEEKEEKEEEKKVEEEEEEESDDDMMGGGLFGGDDDDW